MALVISYVLDKENAMNRSVKKREAIQGYMEKYESYYVGYERDADIFSIAEPIMKTGVKEKDALHVACAIYAKCEYFISTDDRLLKCKANGIELVTLVEFIRRIEEGI